MLADWLAPHNLRWFAEKHFQTMPYARPGAAAEAVPLFTWETLDRVLGSDGPLDVLTVRGGTVMEVDIPRSADAVTKLMHKGISVVIRAAERHDPGLGRLAERFGQELPGEVHVQLYVTPAGTNSYGWHYDFEDVFIQTAGVKDYFFRANTVARETVLGDRLAFEAVMAERSPLLSARLIAGDWLYLPARWWHLVKCVEDSLSISVGVMGPAELGRARRLPAGWTGDAHATSRRSPRRIATGSTTGGRGARNI